MIRTSVRKLDGFVKNITDHSRNSRTNINSEIVNLRELIEECFNDLKCLDVGSKVLLDVDIDGHLEFNSDKKG